MIKNYLELARPRQWPKNLLLLAALLFSGAFLDPQALLKASLGLAVFLLLSSATYAFNDANDAVTDRSHPVKKTRPVASSRVPRGAAYAYAAGLAMAGLGLGWTLGPAFFGISLAYLVLQAAYTLALKHEVILDVFFLAAGFVIRAAAGGLAIGVRVSPWLLVCTTLLALFLGLSKRKAELALLKGGAASHRRALGEYSEALLEQMISVVAAATVVSYMLYATFTTVGGSQAPVLLLTAPYVLYGIFRYLYLSHRKGMAGTPEQVLLIDRPMQLNIALWALTSALILYFSKRP